MPNIIQTGSMFHYDLGDGQRPVFVFEALTNGRALALSLFRFYVGFRYPSVTFTVRQHDGSARV